MNRRIRLGLHDLDQPLAHQLEDGDERNRNTHAPLFGTEQVHEFQETRPLQAA